MNPEAMLRSILQAAETRAQGFLKVEQEYSAALRQLLDKGLAKAQEAEVQA